MRSRFRAGKAGEESDAGTSGHEGDADVIDAAPGGEGVTLTTEPAEAIAGTNGNGRATVPAAEA